MPHTHTPFSLLPIVLAMSNLLLSPSALDSSRCLWMVFSLIHNKKLPPNRGTAILAASLLCPCLQYSVALGLLAHSFYFWKMPSNAKRSVTGRFLRHQSLSPDTTCSLSGPSMIVSTLYCLVKVTCETFRFTEELQCIR